MTVTPTPPVPTQAASHYGSLSGLPSLSAPAALPDWDIFARTLLDVVRGATWAGWTTYPAPAPELDFVHFRSRPGPEDGLVRYELERVVEGHGDAAHVIDILPFAPV